MIDKGNHNMITTPLHTITLFLPQGVHVYVVTCYSFTASNLVDWHAGKLTDEKWTDLEIF